MGNIEDNEDKIVENIEVIGDKVARNKAKDDEHWG